MERYTDNSLNSLGVDAFDHVHGNVQHAHKTHNAEGHLNANGHHHYAAAPVKRVTSGFKQICECANGKSCVTYNGTCQCCGGSVISKRPAGSVADNGMNASGEAELNAHGEHHHHAAGATAWDTVLLAQKYKGLLHSVQALKQALNTRNKAASKSAMEDAIKYLSDLDKFTI